MRKDVGDAMRRVREAIRLGSSTTLGADDTLLTRTDPPETGTDDASRSREHTSTSRAETNTTLAKREDPRDIDIDGRLHLGLSALQKTTPAPDAGADARDALDQLLPSTNTMSSGAWYNDGYRAWFARTTVSAFGGKYVSPVAGLDGGSAGMKWTVEALVEGSALSRLKQRERLIRTTTPRPNVCAQCRTLSPPSCTLCARRDMIVTRASAWEARLRSISSRRRLGIWKRLWPFWAVMRRPSTVVDHGGCRAVSSHGGTLSRLSKRCT